MNYYETLREIDEDIRQRAQGRRWAVFIMSIDLLMAVAINSAVVTSTLPSWCLASVFVVVCCYFGNNLADVTRYIAETPRVLDALKAERAELVEHFQQDLD
jgi:hypothetical protein